MTEALGAVVAWARCCFATMQPQTISATARTPDALIAKARLDERRRLGGVRYLPGLLSRTIIIPTLGGYEGNRLDISCSLSGTNGFSCRIKDIHCLGHHRHAAIRNARNGDRVRWIIRWWQPVTSAPQLPNHLLLMTNHCEVIK